MTINDMTPNISVVIPLYNKELSVSRAIESVLKQTAYFKELIIVNDGSTDNSLAIAAQFTDPRIKLINQTNQGVSVARNSGVAAAKWDYICFLDADDQWHPHFLEEVIKLIVINPQASMFCARYEEVDEYSQRFVGKLVNIDANFIGQLPDFFSCYKSNRSLICSSNSCINKMYFDQVGGYPIQAKIGEDMYLWLNIALLAPVMFSSKISACIYRNTENRSHTREKITIPYHLSYFLDPQRQHTLKASASLKAFIVYNAVIFCLYACTQGDRRAAFAIAKRLIKYNIIYGLMGVVGVCMPRCFIYFLKKLRNKKTLSYGK